MWFTGFHSLATGPLLLSQTPGDVGTKMHSHGESLGSWKVRVSQKLSVPAKPERVESGRAAALHRHSPNCWGWGKCCLQEPRAARASGEHM